MTDADLALLFASLNQRFFGGRLPEYRVLFAPLSRDPSDYWGGSLPLPALGQCDRAARTITVSPVLRMNPERLCEVLAHELCHVEGEPDGETPHGPAFQRRLECLASRGERWALRELPMIAVLARYEQSLRDGVEMEVSK